MPAVDLTGRVIAITGASSGIGAATAVECAKAGMNLVLLARRQDKLDEVADLVRTAGGDAVTISASVADPAHGDAILQTALDRFGGLHAVFANAGFGLEAPVHAMSEEDLRRIFEVNFFGSLASVRPALEHFRAQRRGHVLFCSSCLSKIGLPYYSAYCSTKACQDLFARAMSHEVRADGVSVSSVHPIGTRTAFFDEAARRTDGGLLRLAGGRDRFMQPPSVVGRAVVRCLRRPRPEVWTSHLTRIGLACAGLSPRTREFFLHRAFKSRLFRSGASGDA